MLNRVNRIERVCWDGNENEKYQSLKKKEN